MGSEHMYGGPPSCVSLTITRIFWSFVSKDLVALLSPALSLGGHSAYG